eukprot:GHVU01116203.1.p1 GENE.GHVU01116203.1~~GHVU01116203.1.p1  ORF type:complete len:632 (-),score=34.89 GHVU01116203.1:373-2268(-)
MARVASWEPFGLSTAAGEGGCNSANVGENSGCGPGDLAGSRVTTGLLAERIGRKPVDGAGGRAGSRDGCCTHVYVYQPWQPSINCSRGPRRRTERSANYCSGPPQSAASLHAVTAITEGDWLPSTHRRAALDEMVALLRRGVIGDEAPPSRQAMSLDWRFTEKEGPGADPVCKARLFCKGYMDRTPYETYAGTISFGTLMSFFIYMLTRNWNLWLLDADHAYLQVPLPADVRPIIRLTHKLPHLPPTCPYSDVTEEEWERLRSRREELQPGQLRYLRSSLYGDRRSPFLFHRYLRERLEGADFREVAESLFVKSGGAVAPSVAMAGHVDDFALAGGDELPKEAEVVRGLMDFKPPQKVCVNEPRTFLGMTITRQEGYMTLTQDKYMNSLQLGEAKSHKVLAAHLAPPEAHEIDPLLEKEYRRLNGQLGWAVKTRPHQLVYFSILSRYCAKPSQRLLDAMIRVLTAIKNNPSPLVLRPISTEPCLVCYTDASYNINTQESRVGYIIFLREWAGRKSASDDNAIAWGTRMVKEKLDSSTSAELMALKVAVKAVWEFVPIVKELWKKRARLLVLIDSMPLYDQIRAGKCMTEHKMNKHLGYVLQELKKLSAALERIPREEQKADVMTKAIWFAR